MGLSSSTLPTPTFDPLYGFTEGRKPREMRVTEAEMIALKIPKEFRDYCAYLLVDFEECRKKHFPFIRKCSHEMHNHYQCQYEDYIMRMKEFERERRLVERQKQIQNAAPIN